MLYQPKESAICLLFLGRLLSSVMYMPMEMKFVLPKFQCYFFNHTQGIDSLEDVGCFGLTELGYGNNAVQMETTAIYDKETKEFIVNTPNPMAQKYWITNGACHAHHIIVFSQLYIDGVNQGMVNFFSACVR